MARPLTRTQKLENAAFVKALRRTGNIRLAARETGLRYGTIQYRRKVHPAFAQEMDAAVVMVDAEFDGLGGRTGPVVEDPTVAGDDRGHRTRGGEHGAPPASRRPATSPRRPCCPTCRR